MHSEHGAKKTTTCGGSSLLISITTKRLFMKKLGEKHDQPLQASYLMFTTQNHCGNWKEKKSDYLLNIRTQQKTT